MRLTFLGTGSAMPTGERNQTGLLLENTEDRLLLENTEDRLLLDCGSGVLDALSATEPGYTKLDAVILTHHHLDHVADLLPLLKARWLSDAPRISIAGPPGTEALLDELLDVHVYLRKHVDPDVTDIEAGETTLAGFDVAAGETRHSMAGFGYRLSPAGTDEPAIVFSGDTAASPGILSMADGADVLVHDCSFPDDVETDNHATPASLGNALADADADVGALYLTHLYPHTDGHHEEMIASVREHYDGKVAVASDGLTVEL
ncbi:ribonuclease Z protein [Halorhabdus tiamatea SARL4B]|uniref:Ribonuclease Z n=1 Tax=Halorhabdus tiamatea SARL4B TaxID=1033806 RepID=F7PPI9_9EURY|nr:MBL fold metallo-hydrolase [Halorhabdus tiamatea]ERJ04662.1 ribonuclease Z protein [Halorhabdus tiamatea SARL4B]CCQ34688.1 ribonuclease Z [Halorhabdus tiamatea SARL4B]